ncbi:hypothetical protein DT065_05765 [Salicibibacter kimchii]|uniref:Uncharacterized protein n=1 Tax=Salicibibacter kimchii TaxID=2099786 RepID=A0A345BX94_9BACI|nr:hypothetical protein DT065_05765 [Salicibibacter kimchii]
MRCPSLLPVRTKADPVFVKVSEVGHGSDTHRANFREIVRTSPVFGQIPCLSLQMCPNPIQFLEMIIMIHLNFFMLA